MALLPSLAPISQAQGGTLVFTVCSHVQERYPWWADFAPATQRPHWRAVAFVSFSFVGCCR